MKKWIAMLLVLIMVFGLVACGKTAETETPEKAEQSPEKVESVENEEPDSSEEPAAENAEIFKLGAFLPLSGGGAQSGLEAQRVLEILVEEQNAAGGFNGAEIELVVYDTASSAEEAVKVVTKMIENDNVNACVGSLHSGEVLACAPYLNDAGIVTLGLGTSNSWMEPGYEYLFRACKNDSFGAPATAQMLVDAGMTSVAVFNGADDSAIGAADSFIAACEELGIVVTGRESYDSGDTDYSAQFANLVSTKPDCMYIAFIGQDTGIGIKQLRQAGYEGLVFAKETVAAYQIEVCGVDAAEGVCFAHPYCVYGAAEDCDIPEVRAWIEKYAETYGELNETDKLFSTWDTFMALKAAVETAGTNDSAAIRDAFHTVKIEGMGGTMDFTDDNEAYGTDFNKFVITNGKPVLWSEWLDNGGLEAFMAE